MKRLLVLVFVGALMLAGCGGSDGDNDAGNGDTTTTANNGDPDSNGDNGDSDDPFKAAIANASKANIKITYKQDDGSELTLAQNGEGKTFYGTGDTGLYTDGDTTVSCDGTGSDAECTQLPGGGVGGLGAGLFSVFTGLFTGLAQADDSVFGDVDASTKDIAGREATCRTFNASSYGGFAALGQLSDGDFDPDAEATICVDKETGFLLELSSTSDGETTETFIATEVSEATDADFEPPTTPETIPDFSDLTLPGGGTIPGIGG